MSVWGFISKGLGLTPEKSTSRLDFSSAQVDVSSLCGCLNNDALSVLASYLDFRVSGRFDCCSKAFHVSGFVWNHLRIANKAPEEARERLKLHHKNVISFSCESAADIQFALQFLDLLEHLHIDISHRTTPLVPELLDKLNADRLTSLSIHCWDYTNRSIVLQHLPRILPQLTRIKLVTEPKDESQFFEAVASNCARLKAFHFESEKREFLPESAAAFKQIISANRATLMFVDAHFLHGSWSTLFPTLSIGGIFETSTSWGWQELTEECQNRYGVPFERFGTNCRHSLRNRKQDILHAFVSDSSEQLRRLPLLWNIFKIYYPAETRADRFLPMLSSFKVMFKMIQRAGSIHDFDSSYLVQEMLEFIKESAKIPTSDAQISKMIGTLLVTITNADFLEFTKTWIAAHGELAREFLLKKTVTSRDKQMKGMVFSQTEWLEAIGIDLLREIRIEQQGEKLSAPLGTLLALQSSSLMPYLIKMRGFDPFNLKTASGVKLFDAVFDAFCGAPTHASSIDPEDVSVLLEYALKNGKTTPQELLNMCDKFLTTCRQPPGQQFAGNTYYVRISWMRAFKTVLEDNILFNKLSSHFKSTLDCDFQPEDFERVGNAIKSPYGFLSAVSKLLWLDLLRKFKLKFLTDPAALEARLQILRYHESMLPDFVDDFLERKSDYPIPGVLVTNDAVEIESVRSALRSGCNSVGLVAHFKFNGFFGFSN